MCASMHKAAIVSSFSEGVAVLPLETAAMVIFEESESHSVVILFHQKKTLLHMKCERQLREMKKVNEKHYFGLSGLRSMSDLKTVVSQLEKVDLGFNPIVVEDWKRQVYS